MVRRAFSYARFSTSEQMDGRSLRRQEEAAKAYCARHGLKLDERTFTDLGVSGYKGANSKGGQLGVFLEMVKDGRIPKGSVLIVENIDRLSRLPPHEANEIILAIVKAGVDIATTSPEQVYTASNINQVGTWIPLQVAQCLAAEESRKKGDRLADAWAAKRATAGQKKLSKKGPAWLKVTADRTGWVVIEEKAALVRKMFMLAAEGMGVNRIAGVLHRDCPEGLVGRGWQPGSIAVLLRSRAVLGEYQPHAGTCAKKGGTKKTRKPVGDPIKGYFPCIVDEGLFYRVQAALDGRKKGGGPVTGTPNLFNGILYNAVDGHRMVVNGSNGRTVLVSAGAVRKVPGVPYRSIGYDLFERAILSRLRELKPRDVLDRPGTVEDQVSTLSGRLTVVNQNIAKTTKKAAEADDPDIYLDLLADYAKQKKELTLQLEKATAEAACREGDNLGECVSLIGLLDEAPEDERDTLRSRVRAALRRVVESIWIVIAPGPSSRLTYIQVFFKGGRSREYLLYDLQGRKSRPAAWSVASWADKWGTSHPRDALKDNPTRAAEVHRALTPWKGMTAVPPEEWNRWWYGQEPVPPYARWCVRVAEGHEPPEGGELYVPGLAELIEAMRQAATPTGGSPSPEFIGPLIRDVLGRGGRTTWTRTPRVE